VPTMLTDSWLASPTAQRWMTLALAWLELPRLPGLAGGRDQKDKPIAPLSDELRRPLAPVARRRVLNTLAELPEGAGVKNTEELVAVLAWRAPRRGGRLRDETVRWTMSAAADVESAGHATVYRITEASVRRALDTGRTADELHALFGKKSATAVPQGLSYLIDDVARRHGRLRGGTAGSFLRCDDEVLLAEVLAHPVADEFDLRRIAPTVVVSPDPLGDVLAG